MSERRDARRVRFARGVTTSIMAIDGTWRRACELEDVSDTGARLKIEESIKGLSLKEFFLVLSSVGLAFRRCRLVWVNGTEIGISFIKRGDRRVDQDAGKEKAG